MSVSCCCTSGVSSIFATSAEPKTLKNHWKFADTCAAWPPLYQQHCIDEWVNRQMAMQNGNAPGSTCASRPPADQRQCMINWWVINAALQQHKSLTRLLLFVHSGVSMCKASACQAVLDLCCALEAENAPTKSWPSRFRCTVI